MGACWTNLPTAIFQDVILPKCDIDTRISMGCIKKIPKDTMILYEDMFQKTLRPVQYFPITKAHMLSIPFQNNIPKSYVIVKFPKTLVTNVKHHPYNPR